jgi:hypothetical protein
MATITWTLNVENILHTVRLVHYTLEGTRKIWVDQNLVVQDRKFIDYGSWHFFSILDEEYQLLITTNGITYNYYLLKGKDPIPSDRDRRKGRTAEDLLKTRCLRDGPFWHTLTQLLNLANLPDHEADWASRNRLIGLLRGYVTIVEKRFLPDTTRLVWCVIVRHSPLRGAGAEIPMLSDSRILSLLGNLKKTKFAFNSESDYTVIFMPLIKNETPVELAARVRAFLTVVSEHALILPEDTCENSECKQPFTSERKLILINGLPRLFCQDCVAAIPGWGQKVEIQCKNSPNRLLAGLLAGAGVAILCGLIWGAAIIYINRLFVMISPVILLMVVWSMDKVRTKRTLLSLIISALLTFFSVNLGTLELYFLNLLRHGFSLSAKTFYEAWGIMLAKPALLYPAYLLILFFAGSFIWNLSRQKEYLSGYFKPHVEVFPGKF